MSCQSPARRLLIYYYYYNTPKGLAVCRQRKKRGKACYNNTRQTPLMMTTTPLGDRNSTAKDGKIETSEEEDSIPT